MYNVFNTLPEHPYGAPSSSPWPAAMATGSELQRDTHRRRGSDQLIGAVQNGGSKVTTPKMVRSWPISVAVRRKPTTPFHRRPPLPPKPAASSDHEQPDPAGKLLLHPPPLCTSSSSNAGSSPNPSSTVRPSDACSSSSPRSAIPSQLVHRLLPSDDVGQQLHQQASHSPLPPSPTSRRPQQIHAQAAPRTRPPQQTAQIQTCGQKSKIHSCIFSIIKARRNSHRSNASIVSVPPLLLLTPIMWASHDPTVRHAPRRPASHEQHHAS
ncbi:hypothetical protein ACLOJK_021992 [Asimina triloba]